MGLVDQASDLLDGLAADAEAPEPELVPRTIDLAIAYTAPDGELHEEAFPCTVLGDQARLAAERFAAAMVAPSPWDSLPTPTQNRFLAFAHALWALGLNVGVARRKPSWLVAALADDDDLLALVDGEVRAHRARYFRGDPAAGAGDARGRVLRVKALVGRGRLGEPAT